MMKLHFFHSVWAQLDVTDLPIAPLEPCLLSLNTVVLIATYSQLTIAAFLDLLSTFNFTSHTQSAGHFNRQ